MVDPISIGTMAAISMATSVASGGIQAYGQIQEGKAQQQSGLYQSAVAENNRKIAELAAERAEAEGVTESQRSDIKTAALLGTQKAAQAANGIDVNSGTALAIRQGTREMGMMDSETIIANAAQKAYGYRVQGMNYKAESDFARMKGDNASKASKIAAFGTLVGTAASVSGKWSGYQTKGIYG